MNTTVHKLNAPEIPHPEDLAELHVLHEIETNPGISQREISRRVGISLGLTNLLIRKMARKTWIKVTTVPGRRLLYALTPQGMSEKIRKASDFLRLSLRYYGDMKRSIAERIRKTGRPNPRVASWGAGEMSGIVAEAVQDAKGCYVGAFEDVDGAPVDVIILLRRPSARDREQLEQRRDIVIIDLS